MECKVIISLRKELLNRTFDYDNIWLNMTPVKSIELIIIKSEAINLDHEYYCQKKC